MLISLGRRKQSEDLVDLLFECHERIRSFIRLARDLGGGECEPSAELVDACRRCERYFAEALPLHVDDEEKSILPRLSGHSREVDEALETMESQHTAHGSHVEQLLSSLRAVQSEPGCLQSLERLRVVATQLTIDFEEHLSLEEAVIFPAIRAVLSAKEQKTIVDELRARRQ